eukprot:5221175-Prymnesium_polylepis.1
MERRRTGLRASTRTSLASSCSVVIASAFASLFSRSCAASAFWRSSASMSWRRLSSDGASSAARTSSSRPGSSAFTEPFPAVRSCAQHVFVAASDSSSASSSDLSAGSAGLAAACSWGRIVTMICCMKGVETRSASSGMAKNAFWYAERLH